MDTKDLIETLKTRGVELRINGDRIHAEAPQEPDSNTKALLDEVCQRREEVKALLAGPPCWNCGAQTVETTDIFERVWRVCWGCAVRV
ncbi:MAG: hypothetical protein IH857_01590 [Deltaproteobacteria bacterium]|nr:hypothetical protein [Deltaproteobacteria bacterium]